MKNLIPLCLAAAVAFFASGCSSSSTDTSSTETAVPSSTATTGQELIDLEKAHSSDIITQEEYDKKKEEILQR